MIRERTIFRTYYFQIQMRNHIIDKTDSFHDKRLKNCLSKREKSRNDYLCQKENISTMNGLRREYINELLKDLRGPRLGVCEQISANPSEEYVTGIIVPPTRISEDLINTPDVELTRDIIENTDPKYLVNDDDEYEEEPIYSVPNELNPKDPPKSFGLSFLVSGDNPILDVCVSWARYHAESKIVDDDTSKGWKRIPYLKFCEVTINKPGQQELTIYSEEDGDVKLVVRTLPSSGTPTSHHVIISLVNRMLIPPPPKNKEKKEERSLFQPSIRVNIKNGLLLPNKIHVEDGLSYVHRDLASYARGYMCAAVWKDVDYYDQVDVNLLWPEIEIDPEKTKPYVNCDVRTEFLPLSALSSPDLDWPAGYEKPELSTQKLSEAWDPKLLSGYLQPLIDSYSKWIEQNKVKLGSPISEYSEIEKNILNAQTICIERIKEGIDCLITSEDARLAFCFANKVLWQQNLWKSRQKNPESTPDFVWRPFQIAFFLTCIESLYNPESKNRDTMDLLWVSTGGGKTEAYLAIMAFTISLRRIRAKSIAGEDNAGNTGAGVSVITRYTLRLLTVQQFRRTLLMVTAAEYLRVMKYDNLHGWRPEQCSIRSDWIYGKVRFSTGMLVGGSVTPNHLQDSNKNSKDVWGAIAALEGKHQVSEPAQITKCPVCGECLSIPKEGLQPGEHHLHIVIHTELKQEELEKSLSTYHAEQEDMSMTCSVTKNIFKRSEKSGYYIIKVNLQTKSAVNNKQIDQIIRQLVGDRDSAIMGECVSFRPSRPGYFPLPSFGKSSASPDFEIYCPNPDCDLNTSCEWSEELPINSVKENPFFREKCIPIPAYTVDEQIFHRCPTILICTVDKIAQFAFEPRAGSIFGKVRYFNRYLGYLRGSEKESPYIPKYHSKAALKPENTVDVKPFLPPDLIVQDELHLLEGPLGSMFGLYEVMIRALIKESGGRPKYVSSSATVNHAEKQIKALFNTPTQQFPPYGLQYEDSFFVRYTTDTTWDADEPGKVYMGILCPGRGALTPNIRIWARLLKTGKDNETDTFINNFWTIVGYFNSIRELGGICSLYKADIFERLKQISGDDNIRDFEPDNTEKNIELSARIDSTSIPQLLEMLENGGKQNHLENHNAIFTTSMFGTGVDIPHLSLMIMNGQPKTTSQYIQATGRVGRKHGALIPVLYKPGKPRDLSHYEMFTGYHRQMNLAVEQVSVSPLSTGCLERGLAGIMVAYLRNSAKTQISWENNDGHLIQQENARTDFKNFVSLCKSCIYDWSESIETYLWSQFELWENRSRNYSGDLPYTENTNWKQAHICVVLGNPAHPPYEEKRPDRVWSVFKNVPTSLRDVEDTTSFGV